MRFAFISIASTAIIASAVAFWGFSAIENSQNTILNEALPQISSAQSVVSNLSDFVVIANRLSEPATTESLAALAQESRSKKEQILSLIEQDDVDDFSASQSWAIQAVTLELDDSIFDAIELISENLQRTQGVEQIATQAARLSEETKQSFEISLFELTESFASSLLPTDQDVPTADNSDLYFEIEEGLTKIETFLEAEFRLDRLVGIFERLPFAESLEEVRALKTEAEFNFRRAVSISATNLASGSSNQIVLNLRELNSLVFASGAPFNDMQEIVEAKLDIEVVKQNSIEIFSRVDLAADEITNASRDFALQTAETAQSTLNLSRLVLIMVSALSAQFAVLIIVLYVDRRVVRRLQILTDQTRSLAQGDNSVVINETGSDELSEMAKALKVFQSNALLLEAREKELLRSNAELEQFAYVASHDLQEPLRMVSSYCDLIAKRYSSVLDQNGKEFLAFAIEGAQRMKLLLSDLLGYSRVGRSEIVPGRVSLNTVGAEVTNDLAEFTETVGGQIFVDDLPDVMGDHGLLSRVLLNLIQNGLKFTAGRDPWVKVSARESGGWVTVIVADNGIGIDPKFEDRIFEVFQRLHARSEYGGNGIGLPVSRRIVEQHGGELWLAKSTKEGSEFHFKIKSAQGD